MSRPESTASASAQATWLRRRTHQNIWTRTDTARWLNERNDSALTWVNANPPAPIRSKQIGSWLQLCRIPVFDRIHAALTALPDDAARDSASIDDVLPTTTKKQRATRARP